MRIYVLPAGWRAWQYRQTQHLVVVGDGNDGEVVEEFSAVL